MNGRCIGHTRGSAPSCRQSIPSHRWQNTLAKMETPNIFGGHTTSGRRCGSSLCNPHLLQATSARRAYREVYHSILSKNGAISNHTCWRMTIVIVPISVPTTFGFPCMRLEKSSFSSKLDLKNAFTSFSHHVFPENTKFTPLHEIFSKKRPLLLVHF